MKAFLLSVAFCLCSAGVPLDTPSNYERYEGYRVVEITPDGDRQSRLLRQWMLEDSQLDFWQEASPGESAHIMVSPKYFTVFRVKLLKNGFKWSVLYDNVSKQIEEFVLHQKTRQERGKLAFDLDDFNTYDDIIDWIKNDVPAMCAEGLSCTTQDEGFTLEGRQIVSLTMTSGGSGKKTLLANSLIHAREWITGATVAKIIDHIANNYGTNSEVTNLLNTYNLVFIPVLNPDGYDYTWTNERLWRKNRKPFETCYGVDLNRNYNYNWGMEGVSHDECSNVYCGPSGNSELETQIMDGIMNRYASEDGVIWYLDVHSYGQMWLHPWGNTVDHAGEVCERAEDHDDMFYAADRAADAIENTHNTHWIRGNGCELIYETTGSTDDYIKGAHGVKYPICAELRGNGFIIPPSEIQPSFEEVWNGIVEMTAAVAEREGSY